MKQKQLLSSLFVFAVLFSGCSNSDDEVPPTNPSKIYEATVVASKQKIDGLDPVDEGTRAVFYGGNSARYVTLWDKGDVVHVYKKNGTEVGTLLVTDNANENKDAQFKLTAVLSGNLTGDFEVNEELDLYLPSRARSYNPEEHQKGTINDLSSRFSFQMTSVKIDKIEGTKITLKEANMSHRQAYIRFVLMDEDGNRLHPSKLTISATGNGIITSVPESGSLELASGATTGDVVVEPEIDNGEYPGELFVALVNQGYNEASHTNGSVGAYQLTAIVNGETYVFPGPNETQDAIKVNPSIGKLTKVARRLSKLSSSTSATATLGGMEGQQSFGELSGSATLGNMGGEQTLTE